MAMQLKLKTITPYPSINKAFHLLPFHKLKTRFVMTYFLLYSVITFKKKHLASPIILFNNISAGSEKHSNFPNDCLYLCVISSAYRQF